MRYRHLLGIIPATAFALSGCSIGSHSAPGPSTPSAASETPSQATVSGTPQSAWPTTAPATSTSTSAPSGVKGAPPKTMPKAGETATQFVTDFLHTDGVTQDEWAKKVLANATETFGGRLAGEGLERLPHGVKVTGKAQQLWISDQDPSGEWFVPTSNGGYTALMDLTTPEGKVTDLTPGKDNGDTTESTSVQD